MGLQSIMKNNNRRRWKIIVKTPYVFFQRPRMFIPPLRQASGPSAPSAGPERTVFNLARTRTVWKGCIAGRPDGDCFDVLRGMLPLGYTVCRTSGHQRGRCVALTVGANSYNYKLTNTSTNTQHKHRKQSYYLIAMGRGASVVRRNDVYVKPKRKLDLNGRKL